MKDKRKKEIYSVLLVLLILGISLGYAALSATLNINGSSQVKNNTWDIHFNNVVINPNSVALSTGDSAAVINPSNNTEVTYSVTLQKPGDFYEFTVDAVNAGTIDGMIGSILLKMNGTVIDQEHPLPVYLDYLITYSDDVEIEDNHLLEAGDTETYKVRLEFKKDINESDLPATDITPSWSFEASFVQSDNTAVPVVHPVCIRAKTLHTERCTQSGTSGYCCNNAGFGGKTITYGSLGEPGVLSPGDAFDCDVNNDGVFDSETERFYYVSQLDGNVSNDNSVLIYYNNVTGGEPNNQDKHMYCNATYGENGPDAASAELPTTTQWSNPNLNNNFVRQIKTSNNQNYYTDDGDRYNLPLFTYENRAARLITLNEIIKACGSSSYSFDGYLDNCNYFMENTSYSSSSMGTTGFYTETWQIDDNRVYVTFILRSITLDSPKNTIRDGVRPAIELDKKYIQY